MPGQVPLCLGLNASPVWKKNRAHVRLKGARAAAALVRASRVRAVRTRAAARARAARVSAAGARTLRRLLLAALACVCKREAKGCEVVSEIGVRGRCWWGQGAGLRSCHAVQIDQRV